MFVVSVVCCQVEVSATDWSLVQRSPTDCGVSLCVIKKPRKTRRLKPAPGLWKIQPQWVVTPGQQTTRTTSADCTRGNFRGLEEYQHFYSHFRKKCFLCPLVSGGNKIWILNNSFSFVSRGYSYRPMSKPNLIQCASIFIFECL
jgi:hypothetical protein